MLRPRALSRRPVPDAGVQRVCSALCPPGAVLSLDNDDLLPKIRKPVLITHGADDAVVNPAVVSQQMAGLAHAQIQIMANTGHAPFWDDAGNFNQRLRAFFEAL